ncbi:hypothetical protein T492DRAFT_489137 [Pavlovales sp. CCMP2436]|nr:hypothetical protein T492DRAFT_489137 [Pavlovales sp. CCMP2436]
MWGGAAFAFPSAVAVGGAFVARRRPLDLSTPGSAASRESGWYGSFAGASSLDGLELQQGTKPLRIRPRSLLSRERDVAPGGSHTSAIRRPRPRPGSASPPGSRPRTAGLVNSITSLPGSFHGEHRRALPRWRPATASAGGYGEPSVRASLLQLDVHPDEPGGPRPAPAGYPRPRGLVAGAVKVAARRRAVETAVASRSGANYWGDALEPVAIVLASDQLCTAGGSDGYAYEDGYESGGYMGEARGGSGDGQSGERNSAERAPGALLDPASQPRPASGDASPLPGSRRSPSPPSPSPAAGSPFAALGAEKPSSGGGSLGGLHALPTTEPHVRSTLAAAVRMAPELGKWESASSASIAAAAPRAAAACRIAAMSAKTVAALADCALAEVAAVLAPLPSSQLGQGLIPGRGLDPHELRGDRAGLGKGRAPGLLLLPGISGLLATGPRPRATSARRVNPGFANRTPSRRIGSASDPRNRPVLAEGDSLLVAFERAVVPPFRTGVTVVVVLLDFAPFPPSLPHPSFLAPSPAVPPSSTASGAFGHLGGQGGGVGATISSPTSADGVLAGSVSEGESQGDAQALADFSAPTLALSRHDAIFGISTASEISAGVSAGSSPALGSSFGFGGGVDGGGARRRSTQSVAVAGVGADGRRLGSKGARPTTTGVISQGGRRGEGGLTQASAAAAAARQRAAAAAAWSLRVAYASPDSPLLARTLPTDSSNAALARGAGVREGMGEGRAGVGGTEPGEDLKRDLKMGQSGWLSIGQLLAPPDSVRNTANSLFPGLSEIAPGLSQTGESGRETKEFGDSQGGRGESERGRESERGGQRRLGERGEFGDYSQEPAKLSDEENLAEKEMLSEQEKLASACAKVLETGLPLQMTLSLLSQYNQSDGQSAGQTGGPESGHPGGETAGHTEAQAVGDFGSLLWLLPIHPSPNCESACAQVGCAAVGVLIVGPVAPEVAALPLALQPKVVIALGTDWPPHLPADRGGGGGAVRGPGAEAAGRTAELARATHAVPTMVLKNSGSGGGGFFHDSGGGSARDTLSASALLSLLSPADAAKPPPSRPPPPAALSVAAVWPVAPFVANPRAGAGLAPHPFTSPSPSTNPGAGAESSSAPARSGGSGWSGAHPRPSGQSGQSVPGQSGLGQSGQPGNAASAPGLGAAATPTAAAAAAVGGRAGGRAPARPAVLSEGCVWATFGSDQSADEWARHAEGQLPVGVYVPLRERCNFGSLGGEARRGEVGPVLTTFHTL